MIFILDLDNFSWINNELGHAAGDIAIAAVGRRLRAVAPSHALVARLGGDEFVGWLPGATVDFVQASPTIFAGLSLLDLCAGSKVHA